MIGETFVQMFNGNNNNSNSSSVRLYLDPMLSFKVTLS